METENYISIIQLSTHYEVEKSFFDKLIEVGLIEIVSIKEIPHLNQDKISDLEKMIRLHHELDVNIEGVDVVLNLLQKVDELKNELNTAKTRLKIYE